MAKWTGVVTNAGAELLRGWAAGEALTVTGAEAGSGAVAEAALMAQTAVSGGGKAASLTGSKKLDKAVQLRVQIAAPEEGYALRQIGIWAALDGETPALLALFQNPEGVPIPSAAETKDFLYTFYGVVTLNNSGTVEVLTDGSAWVTLETLNETVGAAKTELSADIEEAKKAAVREAGEAADEKIADHNKEKSAHAAQIEKAVLAAIDQLKLELMTNELTLPLAASGSGEALLSSSGTPLLAAYRPNQLSAALDAVAALEGRMEAGDAAARAYADSAGRRAVAQANSYTAGDVLALERRMGADVGDLAARIDEAKAEAVSAAGTAAEEKVQAAKTELTGKINTAKSQAVSAAETDAAEKVQSATDKIVYRLRWDMYHHNNGDDADTHPSFLRQSGSILLAPPKDFDHEPEV